MEHVGNQGEPLSFDPIPEEGMEHLALFILFIE